MPTYIPHQRYTKMLDNIDEMTDNYSMETYTTDDMNSIFEEINFNCFDDTLPIPAMTIMDDNTRKVLRRLNNLAYDFDGICIPYQSDFLIGVSTGLDSENFYYTVVHEIIHIYCMEKFDYPGHGEKFKDTCQIILDNLATI